MQNEAKVGMFFIAAVILATVVFFFLGDYAGRWGSLTVTAHFGDIAGLESGADVRLSGVRVGRVLKVVLEEDARFPGRPAQAIMAIDRGVMLFNTDKFFVDQGALLGDKYISIVRTEKKQKKRLADGEHLSGAGLAGLSGLAQETQDLVASAKMALHNIEEIFAGPQRKQQVDQMISSVVSLTARADLVSIETLKFAQNLAQVSAQTRPGMIEMSRNLAAASRSLHTTVRMVQEVIATSPVPANAAKASDSLVKATENVRAMTENMAKVLADPATSARFEDAIISLSAASENLASLTDRANRLVSDEEGIGENLKETMVHLRQATGDLADTSAHIKELLTDPQLTEDFKVAVAKTRETLEDAANIGETAARSLDRVDSAMDRIGDTLSSVRPSYTETHVTIEGATDRGLRTDFNADLYYRLRTGDFWRIGMHDVGGAERLSLQRSVPLSDSDSLRAGIFGGKPGLGYDRALSDSLELQADLWDADAARFDLRLHYRLQPGLDLTLGGYEMFSGSEPFIGLRYYLSESEALSHK